MPFNIICAIGKLPQNVVKKASVSIRYEYNNLKFKRDLMGNLNNFVKKIYSFI